MGDDKRGKIESALVTGSRNTSTFPVSDVNKTSQVMNRKRTGVLLWFYLESLPEVTSDPVRASIKETEKEELFHNHLNLETKLIFIESCMLFFLIFVNRSKVKF